jgi:predicted TIM-barrel fold metal-dependent hydrolase
MCGHPKGVSLNRRHLLAGLAAPLVGAAGPATAPAPNDVHHHHAPPIYTAGVADWLASVGSAKPVLDWTPESMLAGLDRAGGVRAVMSVSAPATTLLAPADAIAMARRCNDYASELSQRRPGQLAFFVTLPMPDVAASIAELDRALALPGAAGVALMTSYGGRYLGSPAFDPLMQRLHDRKTVAFVHPTAGACCMGLTPEVATSVIEFPVDTGRAIGTLIWSGALNRYTGVRFIFSHGGGIAAMLTQRLDLVGMARPDAGQVAPGGADAMLRRIYVDTASASHPTAIGAARSQFGEDHVLFGTDAPWGDAQRSLAMLDRQGLDPAVLDGIRQGNARKLLTVFS